MRFRQDVYDLILVGTSFASSFFLLRYLKHRPQSRVLVLERGPRLSHAQYGERLDEIQREASSSYDTDTPAKPWIFRLAFGGTSNCWAACTPRMTPEDFELRSRYGVAVDWPIKYDDLERYYYDAEEAMAVSGPNGVGLWPRSRPYPQPPHRLSAPDLRLQAAAPELWFAQPCARPTRRTANGRPPCCATGNCSHCPIDSKFTVLNELGHLYQVSGVELRSGAQALEVEHAGNTATGVRWLEAGREHRATAAVVALGANAIFNPHLLLRSGLDAEEVGRGLVEQVGVGVMVDLDGLDAFGGSTLITAMGYPLHDGAHRAHRAAALIESHNSPIRLRDLRGRWRQRLVLKVVFEDLRQASNRVTLSADSADRPSVTFKSHSSYTQAGIDSLWEELPRVLRALPIDSVNISPDPGPTSAHAMGTTPMGRDAATSVVDADLRHHRLRNLLVLGASVFPTCPPANPTLTLSALSLRAADQLLS